MSNLLESYRILGVKVGADFADVTTSYKQLCREYHPDISDKPDAEELMKQVNIAYTVLREKFKREAAFRERASTVRPVRRHTTERPRPEPPKSTAQAAGQAARQAAASAASAAKTAKDPMQQAAEAFRRQAAEQAAISAAAETDSRRVLHDYFKALNAYNYKKAYEYISDYDKRNISLEAFTGWREAVTRLYPMREFKIAAGSSVAMVTWGGSSIFQARKFKVLVKEDDYTASREQSGEHDKLVIIENGKWRVFLGYKEVSELTRAFEKRFEVKKKQDIDKLWAEYAAGIDVEYDMLTMTGLKKAATKEIYRQRRYGSAITFAALKFRPTADNGSGNSEMLRTVAKTINSQLRELDLCAYAGDGVFAILFVELGRRNAPNTIKRLVEMIKRDIGSPAGDNIEIIYHYDCWSENRYADFEQVNNVLRVVGKRI